METRLLKSQDFKLEKTTLSLFFFISIKSIITHVYFTQNVSRHPSLDQGSPMHQSSHLSLRMYPILMECPR